MPTLPSLEQATDNSTTQIEDRIRLARAVLGRGERVRVVRSDNTLVSEYVDVAQAAALGVAYAGDVDPEILALDVDPSEKPDSLKGLSPVCQGLRANGVTPVLVNSGRPGHLHLFARVTDAKLREQMKVIAETHGITVRRCIRLPLSPHRSGDCCTLRHPMTVALAEHVLRRREYRPLGTRLQRVLETGESDYLSDSEMIMGLSNSMFQAGWNFGQAFEALEHNPGGHSLVRAAAQPRGACVQPARARGVQPATLAAQLRTASTNPHRGLRLRRSRRTSRLAGRSKSATEPEEIGCCPERSA